jgi:hypothetical protein
MKWPKGKYNGELIQGFRVCFIFRVFHWRFKAGWNMGMPFLFVGPFCWRFEPEYKSIEPK